MSLTTFWKRSSEQLEAVVRADGIDAMIAAQAIEREAAREAVNHLGYLKPETAATIALLMAGSIIEHPRAICTAYRKAGEQLSSDEKKALGIRANGFLSRRAFDDLTDVGKANPLTAHEVTLLRAVFTENRFRRLMSHGLDHVDGYRYDTTSATCPFCKRMDGQIVPAEDVAIFPAPDCECETANYGISPYIDWLKDID